MTDGTIRTARHAADEAVVSAKASLSGVPDLLKGRPGYSAAEQSDRLEKAQALIDDAASVLGEASEALDEAILLVDERASEDESDEDEVDSKAALNAAVKALAEAVAAL